MQELRVADLDFDLIKNNLKIFLENQPGLQDYNFLGTTLNTIMDLLAYHTYYGGIYANQALNETFLDTALIRSSVVSRAKELGYIPRQFTSAFVPVNISITVPSADSRVNFEIPKGTVFTGEKAGSSVPFVTTQQFVLTEKTGDVFSGQIILREGEFVVDRFIFDSTVERPKFVVTPEKVDTEFTQVEILPFQGAATKEIWTEAASIVQLDKDSKVFFWQENRNGDLEIFFGDGSIGQALTNGNEIVVTTLSNNGIEGNEVQSFIIAQNVADINRANITVSPVDYSKSGSDRESIESIRTLAPRLFSVQDRLVTLEDYRAYISKNFGNIQSFSVWSGDENVPPFFGRVFLSVKPKDSDNLSTFEKTQIINDINEKKITGITIQIVDPELLFVDVKSVVTYDSQSTTFFAEQFEEIVSQSIKDFFDENINDLGNDLVYSKLVSNIDNSNSAIIGNLTSVSLSKKFIPDRFGSTYIFDFGNELEVGSFDSEIWTDGLNNFFLKENETKGIDLYRDGLVLNRDIGTINHSTGIVEFRDFSPSININQQITLNVVPLTNDITALRNNILVRDNIEVEVIGR